MACGGRVYTVGFHSIYSSKSCFNEGTMVRAYNYSPEAWAEYKQHSVEYVVQKNFITPGSWLHIYLRFQPEGVVLMSNYKSRDPVQARKQAPAFVRFWAEDVLNLMKPTIFRYSDIISADIDYRKGFLSLQMHRENLKLKIIYADNPTLEDAAKSFADKLSSHGVRVRSQTFGPTQIYNTNFLLFIGISVIVIVVLIILQS